MHEHSAIRISVIPRSYLGRAENENYTNSSSSHTDSSSFQIQTVQHLWVPYSSPVENQRICFLHKKALAAFFSLTYFSIFRYLHKWLVESVDFTDRCTIYQDFGWLLQIFTHFHSIQLFFKAPFSLRFLGIRISQNAR